MSSMLMSTTTFSPTSVAPTLPITTHAVERRPRPYRCQQKHHHHSYHHQHHHAHKPKHKHKQLVCASAGNSPSNGNTPNNHHHPNNSATSSSSGPSATVNADATSNSTVDNPTESALAATSGSSPPPPPPPPPRSTSSSSSSEASPSSRTPLPLSSPQLQSNKAMFAAIKPFLSVVAAAALLIGTQPRANQVRESDEDKDDDTPKTVDTANHVDGEIDITAPTSVANKPPTLTNADTGKGTTTDNSQKAIRIGKTALPTFPGPDEWDFDILGHDASMWTVSAAVMSGVESLFKSLPLPSDVRTDTQDGPRTRSFLPLTDKEGADSDANSLGERLRNVTDGLSEALNGLGQLSNGRLPSNEGTNVMETILGFRKIIMGEDDMGVSMDSQAERGANRSSARSDADTDDDVRDLNDSESSDIRPIIAVSIGVALFLLTRSSGVARRVEDGSEVETPLVVDDDELDLVDNIDLSEVSDLSKGPRDIVIVTTAALPWMTGTAVNPLLRAVYLAKKGHAVTLMVPWLESPEDQRMVYPKGTQFSTRDDQARVMLRWAHEQVPDVALRIRYYDGVYSEEFGSILPLGDITALFGNDDAKDVCVLEEPEHLTWFHTGRRWTKMFRFCVGVVHTNYLEYAKNHGVFGPQRALFLSFLNKWVCRSYCHRVIKLSDAVQTLPHSVTCNVHGVRDKFIDIGRAHAANHKVFERGAYFLGKVLWAKGYEQLVELIEDHYARTEERLDIDFFGSGPDLKAVRQRVNANYALSRVQIHGIVIDHASEYIQKYKVYVNPSKSDVVCTATAEALAMGKFVVCLKHPSNEFFATFDNCFIYETPEQFSALLQYALSHQPKPLSDLDAYRLSWVAATDRFYEAAYVAPSSKTPALGRVDSALALTHKTICATLVTPPANNAIRSRYKRERKLLRDQLARAKRAERERRRQQRRVPVR